MNQGQLNLVAGSDLYDLTAVSVDSGAVLNVAVSDVVGSIAGQGDIQLSAAAALSAGSNNSSTTFTGAISGDGSLIKQGAGTLELSGTKPKTYTGGTSVNAGTLRVSSDGGLADASTLAIASGAIFDLNLSDVIGSFSGSGDIQLASGVTLSAGSDNTDTTFTGVISGDGALIKQGTGTLELSGSSAKYVWRWNKH